MKKSAHLRVGAWWTDGKRKGTVIGGIDGKLVQLRTDWTTVLELSERYFLRRFRPTVKRSGGT